MCLPIHAHVSLINNGEFSSDIYCRKFKRNGMRVLMIGKPLFTCIKLNST